MKKTLFPLLLLLPIFSIGQIISTVAGNSIPGYAGDGGPATNANLQQPYTPVVDAAGNIYVVENYNNVVRKINTSGVISTYAGNGVMGFSGDGGAATAAQLKRPCGLALDATGNLYIVDQQSYRIRKVNTSGIITTFAGNGGSGHTGDGGPATAASIGSVYGINFDGIGNMYLSQYNSYIRKIDVSGVITTVAGIGGVGFSGDGGSATAAQLNDPKGVAVDNSGNIYFADGDRRIRKVDASGIITTIAGSGVLGSSGDGGPATIAQMNVPFGLCVDGVGNVFFADYGNSRVRKISPSGIISLVAGNGVAGYSGDGGLATAAQLNHPTGVNLDATGNLYIADMYSNVVRKVGPGSTSGINDLPVSNFMVSPNPVTEALIISAMTKINTVTICNHTGQQVYSYRFNTEKAQINVADLRPGVYFVRINDMETRTFIKE